MDPVIRGTCPFCLTTDSVLINSHILPKWAYKRARQTNTPGNPNPVVVDVRKGKIIRTSRQTSEAMLCAKCDQNLGRCDRWAAEALYQRNGTAPLLARGTRVARGYIILPEAEAGKLALFCLSVFWRAHLSRSMDVSLGTYAEGIRGFLHDSAPLPPEVALVTFFHESAPNAGSILDTFFAQPVSSKNRGFFHHRFVLFGLDAVLGVGKLLRPEYHSLCIVKSNPRRLVLEHTEELINWMAEPVAGVIRRRRARGLPEV